LLEVLLLEKEKLSLRKKLSPESSPFSRERGYKLEEVVIINILQDSWGVRNFIEL